MSLTASIIEDAANEAGLTRVRIDRNEFLFVITFGPINHRQTMQLDPEWDEATLRAKLPGDPSRSPSSLVGSKPAPPALPSPTLSGPPETTSAPVQSKKPGRPRKPASTPDAAA